MNFNALATDAGHSGWLVALLARTTARLEHLAGLWVFRVNVRSLAHLPTDSLSPPKGVTVRLLTEAQLVHHARDPRYCLDSRFIRRAISRGDLAYGAFEDGRLVGYTWRAASTAPFFEDLWIKVPQPLVYGYKSYVLPSHRGRGIYAAFAGFADRQSRAVGHPMALALISISNLASLRASAQMGSRTAGYAGYLKLFGRCFTFRTSLVRAVGIEFYAPAREIRAAKRRDALALLNGLLVSWGSVLSRLRHAVLPPAPTRSGAATGNG
jgi:GNAT superfamily N-acetyltransferase